ncbi:sensor histidine kinase [Methylomonas sp. LL1]|uniref:sensor histidine kinase n=1 Tax=Methylomonas sp. LL1 TaxID=2785785 RepID=UPI001E4D446C|nr:sensor histidine kinase [Methylomonas sp. LL1]
MSLRRRLNRGLAIILCVIFAAHWSAADWVIRAVAEKQMLTRLTHDGDSLLDTLSVDANGQLRFDSSHAGSVYGQAYSGHYFVIHIGDRVFYSVSLQGQTLPFAPTPKQTSRQYHFDTGPHQQPLLVLSRGFEKFGHQVSISIAEDLTDIGHDILGIRIAYFGLSLLVLAAAILLQTSDVRRALMPIKAVRRELAQIANGNQQQINTLVPVEIRPLVKEVNRLLLLVERRLNQSRTAIGNLAHALKTPLAMLFRLAEDPILREHPDFRQQFQQQNDAILQRIDRELKRARISGSFQTGAAFNPHLELTAVVNLLRNIYSDKQFDVEVRVPDQLMRYDREDMLELIGNLLDNAFKWARRRILVEVDCRYGAIIRVSDDGPGCTEAEIAQLSQRGMRLDEAVQGHGLGLAIVRDIAEFYAGSLQIGRSSQLGGLSVTVQLPH